MTCERCGSDEGVRLSTGLVICPRCFWSDRLDIHFLDKRFGGNRAHPHR